MRKFNGIKNELIVSANDAALGFLKEANKVAIERKIVEKYYFIYMQLHSILYNFDMEDKEKSDEVERIIDLNELYKTSNEVYETFWRVLITTDKDGVRYDTDLFLSDIDEMFNKGSRLYGILKSKVDELFPEVLDKYYQTYQFIFVNDKKLVKINFKAKMTEEMVGEMLLSLKDKLFNSKKDNAILEYLYAHDINYKDYDIKAKKNAKFIPRKIDFLSNYTIYMLGVGLDNYSTLFGGTNDLIAEDKLIFTDANNNYLISYEKVDEDGRIIYYNTIIKKTSDEDNVIIKSLSQQYEPANKDDICDTFIREIKNGEVKKTLEKKISIPEDKCNDESFLVNLLVNINHINNANDVPEYLL